MRLAPVAQTVFILLAAIAVYSFVSAARDGERRRACASLCYLSPNYADDNRLAPDFELPTLRGQRLSLSALRGKTVVLNFWSTACPPCLKEMPSLAELARSLADREDVAVVTVSTDDTSEGAKSTLRSVLGGDAPFVTALDPEAKVVTGKFGTKLYPETWIIDPQGVIVARFDGARDWSSPLLVDFATSLGRAPACPVKFSGGRPAGQHSGLCDAIVQ